MAATDIQRALLSVNGLLHELSAVAPVDLAHMSLDEALQAQPARSEEIVRSVKAEVTQLVCNDMFAGIEPLELKDPALWARLMRGKFDVQFQKNAEGTHKKVKTRGVANPNSLPLAEKLRRKERDGKPSSPTASADSLWIHLALIAVQRRIAASFDVNMAFMHCLLKEGDHYYYLISPAIATIALAVRPSLGGGLRPDGSLIVQLKGPIYGLPESGLYFYNLFDTSLVAGGYLRSDADPCVYATASGSRVELDVSKDALGNLHVDDCLASFRTPEEHDKFREFMARTFKLGYTEQSIDQEGGISHLGLHIRRSPDSGDISAGQPGYETRLISTRLDADLPGSDCPHGKNLFRIDPDSPLLNTSEQSLFHTTVHELAFLARTRLALAPAVSFLRQRVLTPTREDRAKLTKALRYLSAHPHQCRIIRCATTLKLGIHADGGHASHADYRGHTGVAIFLGLNLVALICRKQSLQTHSSAETELVAVAEGVRRGLLIRAIAIDMGAAVNSARPTPVYQDNQSAITIANRGHGTNRHIGKRFQSVKDDMDAGLIRLLYRPSVLLCADVLTKPLTGEPFHRHIATLMAVGVPPSA